jgi:hypothetical protein
MKRFAVSITLAALSSAAYTASQVQIDINTAAIATAAAGKIAATTACSVSGSSSATCKAANG